MKAEPNIHKPEATDRDFSAVMDALAKSAGAYLYFVSKL
jgi:hypothetical protein